MFLHISDYMTIEEVQDRFRECFPGLEIHFYASPFNTYTAFNLPRLPKTDRIEYIRHYHYNGALEIKSWFSAARVEQELKEMFDLNAGIFRINKSGTLIHVASEDELVPHFDKHL